MRITLLGLVICLFASLANSTRAAEPTKPGFTFAKDLEPFLTKHCASCHGQGKKKGGVSLDKFRDDESVQRDRKTWDLLVHLVSSGEMPPKGQAKPTAAESENFVKAAEYVLANFDCSKVKNPGRVTLRRLNKTEYNYTIRDLLGIDFEPAQNFPNDDVGYGFDNIGDVLSLSPLLFERYLQAAESALSKALTIREQVKPTKQKLGSFRFIPLTAGEVRRGAATLIEKGETYAEGYFDEGEYTITLEVFGRQVGDEKVKGVLRLGRTDLQEFTVKATEANPENITIKTKLPSGTARFLIAFLNPVTDPKATDPLKKQSQLAIRTFTVDGPYNAPIPVQPELQKKLLAQAKDASPRDAAKEILSRFASRAFRRPVQSAELARLVKIFEQAQQEKESFHSSLRTAMSAVLVSPHFLFRVELDPADAKPGSSYPVNEYELASRLSYFLWSTMPDEELFDLAATGKLRQQLGVQVERMLKDPKSAAFVSHFSRQWLTLNKLETVVPDPKVFPNFDADLRKAMLQETQLFFGSIVRENRSILDLLDSDYSFVNERLAKHYGIAGVQGNEFVRVKLPADRGGLLTQASILTLTSNNTRTSPVQRGKWVLEQILNTPPPPPPPDVPEIKEEKRLTGSLRQVLEQHRDSPICASCHKRMDPLGFAFEHYDAIGAWRDKDGKFPIDALGVLPSGQKFNGAKELKAVLLEKKELFARCLAEKIMTYALGRGLEYYDRCAIDKLLAELTKHEYRFGTLVIETVKSEPFQQRVARGAKE